VTKVAWWDLVDHRVTNLIRIVYKWWTLVQSTAYRSDIWLCTRIDFSTFHSALLLRANFHHIERIACRFLSTVSSLWHNLILFFTPPRQNYLRNSLSCQVVRRLSIYLQIFEWYVEVFTIELIQSSAYLLPNFGKANLVLQYPCTSLKLHSMCYMLFCQDRYFLRPTSPCKGLWYVIKVHNFRRLETICDTKFQSPALAIVSDWLWSVVF
jgi:hypothetical protein